jgi:glycosyltransferase involved in cell wall biosynthesis
LLHAASRASLRKVALGANAVYSTNEHLDHTLRRYGFGSPKIVRGPLPFDSKRLDGWSSTDGEAFVFHGQALAIKGAHLLPGIVKAVPGARFLLAPLRGPHGDEMLARLVALRSARVEVDTGIRWETGLAKRIAGARGVLLPSVWPSTTEYALLEALGWGKPVVAFPVGVNREILVDEENAMIVPTGDVAGFARAVSRLDEDPALRRRLAAGARRTFEALTSTRTIREALVRLYVPDESQG